jgi:hypothetical protein
MTNYVLAVNEKTRRGKMVKQLLQELTPSKDIKLMTLKEYERIEDEWIASEIKKRDKESRETVPLEVALKKLDQLRKKLSK